MSKYTLEKIVNKAISYGADERHEEAAKILSKGMELCECQFLTTPPSLPPTSRSPNPRVPCVCRDFVNAAIEGTVMSISEQACTCLAQRWKKCENRAHHGALSLQVSFHVRLKQLDQALARIGHFLELNPSHPEAYLRLGQTLRLEKPGDHGKATQALKVYTTGLEVAKRNPLPEFATQYETLKTMREKLSSLFQHQRRLDPITKFPPEILELIFHEFNLGQISQLTRVSKSWNQRLTSEPRLWRVLLFASSSTKEPGVKTLREICRRSNFTANTLILKNGLRAITDTTARKIHEILRLSPQLSTLRLEAIILRPVSIHVACPGPGIFTNVILKRLSTIYLGIITSVGLPFMLELVAGSGAAVECLTILNGESCLFVPPGSLPTEDLYSSWIGKMESLTYLRIGQHPAIKYPFYLDQLAAVTPNLKQLVIDSSRGCHFSSSHPQDERDRSSEEALWPNLEVFKNDTSGEYPKSSAGMFFDTSKLVLFDCTTLENCPVSFKKLKYYHMPQGSCIPHHVQSALACEGLEFFGANAGHFQDLNNVLFNRDFLPHFGDGPPIKGFGLMIDFWDGFNEETVNRVLTVLGKCPYVESVTVQSVGYMPSRQESVVLGLLRSLVEMKVKRIHEDCLLGVRRDEFYAYGREHGVQVFRISVADNSATIPIDLSRDWTKPFMRAPRMGHQY